LEAEKTIKRGRIKGKNGKFREIERKRIRRVCGDPVKQDTKSFAEMESVRRWKMRGDGKLAEMKRKSIFRVCGDGK
jgi:hypothetical protein